MALLPGFARRLAAVTVTVTVAALAVAGTLAPALAATGPSMTVNAGAVNIAVQGPNNSLLFYWAVNGTPTWYGETVAGAGTTFSDPSMAVDGNGVIIAAQGPNDSLLFYWAVNGSSTWHAETVAGAGTTFAPPSVATDGQRIDIAAVGPGNSLDSYSQVNGASTWTTQVLQQPDPAPTIKGVGAFSVPAAVITGGMVYIAVESFGKALSVYDQTFGAGTWDFHLIGTANSAPSMTATGNAVNISTTAVSGEVLFYWAFDGTVAWHAEAVSGGLFAATSIATDSSTNSAMIAATTFAGSLEFFSAAYGTGSWSSEPVSGADTVSPYLPTPVINADSFDGYNGVNISVFGHEGQLLLDYSAFGSGIWYSEAVPGNGTIPHL